MKLLGQTEAEFRDKYLTYRRSSGNHTHMKVHVADPAVEYYPESIDWRTKGAVSSVKHQVKQRLSLCTKSVVQFILF